MSLSSTAPSGIPGDLPVVFSLAKYRGSAWWTKYFPRSSGIEIRITQSLRRAPQQGTSVRILRRAPVRWNSGRRQLYIVTSIFIPGFLLLDWEVFSWSCGIEIESNLEFTESSTLGDSSKDSAVRCNCGRRQLHIVFLTLHLPTLYLGFLFLDPEVFPILRDWD